MKTSILYKELYQSKCHQTVRDFWQIDDDQPREIYCQIQKKMDDQSILKLIENLEEDEAIFFYTLLANDGMATSLEFLQKKVLSEQEMNLVSHKLQQKCLIFIRKSIQQIKIVAHSFHLFPEIYQFFKTIPLCTIADLKKIAHNDEAVHEASPFSEKWQTLFKVNLGQYHTTTLENSELQQELSKQLKEGNCYKMLLFHKRLFTIISLKPNKQNYLISESVMFQPEKRKLLFFTSLYKLFYYLKTQKIFLTNKKEIRKHDYDLLTKLLDQDKILLNRLIQFSHDAEFLSISNNQFQTNSAFIGFMKMSIQEKLETILQLYPEVNFILELASQLNQDTFSVLEIAEHYFESRVQNHDYFSYNFFNHPEITQSKIVKSLELLSQLGIITVIENKYAINTPGRYLLAKKNIEKEPIAQKGGVVVNNDHTILIYPDLITHYHGFLIELFACKQSDEIVWEYRFDKNSIQKGIYLGLQENDFIQCLIDNSEQPLSESILYNIRSWANKIKKVFIKQITVLHGDPDILHLLRHQKEIGSKLEPIGNNYILCTNSQLPFFVEADDPVFLIHEGDDLNS